MKSYIGQRPPGWAKRPDQPVIIVTGDEEARVRENLYAFSDFWRKVRRRAEQIITRNPGTIRVDICNAEGEVIRSVQREARTEDPWPTKSQEKTGPQINLAQPAVSPIKAPTAIRKAETSPTISESKKRGRPQGKRSNPDFTQITAYVRTKTLDSVKIKLIKQGSKQDASELIEELLSAWLCS